MSQSNLYQILEVSPGATDGEIKAAYRRLAMKAHPDRPGGDHDRFNDLSAAFRILTNPETRRAYDQHLLDSLIASRPVELTLEQAYTGCTVSIMGQSVEIPPGSSSGDQFSVGERLISIHVKSHDVFKRSGDDLLVDLKVDSFQAILGAMVSLEHISKTVLKFNLPRGTDQGAVIKIGGRGMKKRDAGGYGDLLVRVTVNTPKNLTSLQASLLRENFDYEETIKVGTR